MSGRLPVDAPLIAGHVSLQTWHPTRAGGGSRRAHRSYAVRMSDSRVSPRKSGPPPQPTPSWGPGYCDAVMAPFQG